MMTVVTPLAVPPFLNYDVTWTLYIALLGFRMDR